MAHKRKDTYVKSPEWWKHLRKFCKRLVNKKERKYAKNNLLNE